MLLPWLYTTNHLPNEVIKVCQLAGGRVGWPSLIHSPTPHFYSTMGSRAHSPSHPYSTVGSRADSPSCLYITVGSRAHSTSKRRQRSSFQMTGKGPPTPYQKKNLSISASCSLQDTSLAEVAGNAISPAIPAPGQVCLSQNPQACHLA